MLYRNRDTWGKHGQMISVDEVCEWKAVAQSIHVSGRQMTIVGGDGYPRTMAKLGKGTNMMCTYAVWAMGPKRTHARVFRPEETQKEIQGNSIIPKAKLHVLWRRTPKDKPNWLEGWWVLQQMRSYPTVNRRWSYEMMGMPLWVSMN